jgi:hypothetical protein
VHAARHCQAWRTAYGSPAKTIFENGFLVHRGRALRSSR